MTAPVPRPSRENTSKDFRNLLDVSKHSWKTNWTIKHAKIFQTCIPKTSKNDQNYRGWGERPMNIKLYQLYTNLEQD